MFYGCTLYQPSKKRMERWLAHTSVPFDPLEALKHLDSREMECPMCRTLLRAPYLTKSGPGHVPGYAQPGFSIACKQCKVDITRERLGLGRFTADLVKNLAIAGGDYAEYSSAYLAGTLLSRSGSLDKAYASRVKATLLHAEPFKLRKAPAGREKSSLLSLRCLANPAPSPDPDWARDIQKRLDRSFENARTAIRESLGQKEHDLAERIMSAYQQDRPFSIDLAGAVMRQGAFVEKMSKLGWTDLHYFDGPEREAILSRALARYCGFMDLMHSSPTSFFVPTLEIDLAWHTHQLMGDQYARDCLAHVGRFIDHDDKVEEDRLSVSFEKTCEAWQGRFGHAYLHECRHSSETTRLCNQKLSNSDKNDLADGFDVTVPAVGHTGASDDGGIISVTAVIISDACDEPAGSDGPAGCNGGCGGGGCGGGCGGGGCSSG